VDVVEHHLGLEALGVLHEALHQFGALHAVDVGGPVVHFGGGHQLTALGHAGHQHGVQIGAGCVDGRGVAGRAGTQNQDFGVLVGGHRCFSKGEVLRACATPVEQSHGTCRAGVTACTG